MSNDESLIPNRFGDQFEAMMRDSVCRDFIEAAYSIRKDVDRATCRPASMPAFLCLTDRVAETETQQCSWYKRAAAKLCGRELFR